MWVGSFSEEDVTDANTGDIVVVLGNMTVHLAFLQRMNVNAVLLESILKGRCKMGRLTRRLRTTNEADCAYCTYQRSGNGNCSSDCELWRKQLEKLAHYEDLEEQGRLIEVIRCSECEHYDNVGCADGCGWCDYWDIGRFTDGYCDGAKLKELEGDKQ